MMKNTNRSMATKVATHEASRTSIHTMNALKAWLTTVSNGVATILFILTPHVVYWPQAILMIIAAIAGGYFGAFFARKTKPEYVRAIVIVIGFALTIYFFALQIWG